MRRSDLKKLLFCLFSITFLAVTAVAQDEKPFTGFHVGGYVGGSMVKPTLTMSAGDTGSYFAASSVTQFNTAGRMEPDGTAFTGGGTFGYDYQGDEGWVFGFEVDFGAMKIDEAETTGPIEYTCCPGTFFDITQGIETSWLFTARPRIGYVFGNAMPYFTGGLALTNLEYAGVFTDDFGPSTEFVAQDDKRVGWTVGGGLEYKFNKHFSMKGEYLYTNFGDDTIVNPNVTVGGVATPEPITHRIELHSHSGRVGFNFWF
jgi:outer membrane immunogenic protein